MSMYEIVMLALVMLLPAVIGFVGGMVFMRFCYIDRLRAADKKNSRLERRLMEAGKCM